MVDGDLPLRDRSRWAGEILSQSRIAMTEDDLHNVVVGLSEQIRQDLCVLYPVVISVMSGSLMFSSDLLRFFDFPIDFDYLDVSRYRRSIDPSDIRWYSIPRTSLLGRHVLLIDDILDQGITLRAVYEWLVDQEVKSVRIAVLCERQTDKCDVRIRADYVGFKVYGSSFVFGYGMDIYGFWRNLPAVYAYDRNDVSGFDGAKEDGF
ncbi:phosphoribosyltransferase family protein [Candidatus Ichthyocystis hellenicum]|uniref:phosphoribosyltransferase family protein n=1 Tax=Candidatus Ichthyocystis hellenicum TaxID=1561003 RepID=UPI000A5B7ECB|nr:phosphoribosyltransferase family protein [Candidatus Ichthyocystis hellenicum]